MTDDLKIWVASSNAVGALARVGDFSWTFFSNWVNFSGHFLRVNFCGHFLVEFYLVDTF